LTYTYGPTYQALINSLLYATTGAISGLMIGLAFAWLIERTDMPFRGIAWVLIVVPIAIPSFLLSLGYILLLNPTNGVLNVMLRGLLATFGYTTDSGPVNIYSLGGMLYVNAISGGTSAFLLLVSAFRLMDQQIEDAAMVCGASKVTTLRRVTLPILLPAITVATIYKFAGDLNDMDVPLLLGLQSQIYVLPTLIFFSAFYSDTVEWGLATALSSPFILIALGLSYLFYHVIVKNAQQQRYATVGGKTAQSRRVQLGKWRYGALAMFLLYFLLSTGLPFAVLLWASLLPSYRVPSWEALSLVSLANYLELLQWPNLGPAVWNTLLLGLYTGTIVMAVAFFTSWIIIRSQFRGRFFLDALTFLPHVLPGSVVALGLVFTYLHPTLAPAGLYGTLFIMALGMMVGYLPFATRVMNGSLTQIHKELEEAGTVNGARAITVLMRVTLPLVLPAFLTGFIWVAAHAFRSLTMPLMLGSAETETISVILFNLWERDGDFSGAAALGMVLILITATLTMLARKFIQRAFGSWERK
jgi:iron(III) transport system permease protein